MSVFADSLSTTSERNVEWKYTGHFLQMGILHYTQPETQKQLVIEMKMVWLLGLWMREENNEKATDWWLLLVFFYNEIGVFILPIIKGSAFKEPHILVIKGYRAAVESFSLSFPAGTAFDNKIIARLGGWRGATECSSTSRVERRNGIYRRVNWGCSERREIMNSPSSLSPTPVIHGRVTKSKWYS